MKNKLMLVLLVAGAITFAGGCVSSNPNPANPQTSLYEVSPNLTNTAAQVQAGVGAVASTVSTLYPPAAPIAQGAVTLTNLVLGGLFAVSAMIAGYKNQQANAHSNAAAALASVVSSTPTLVQQALQNAASNNSGWLVQQHIANANKPV